MWRPSARRSRQSRQPGGGVLSLPRLLVAAAMIPILPAIVSPMKSPSCLPGDRPPDGRAVRSTIICMKNLRQLALAVRAYANDWDGGLPFVSGADARGINNWAGQPGSGGHPIRVDQGTLWPYLKHHDVYQCPSDKGLPSGDNRVPPFKYPNGFPLSYSMNYRLSKSRVPYKIDDPRIRRPDLMLLFIHEARQTINDGAFVWDVEWDKPTGIHFDGANCCYLDGHVKWQSFPMLMNVIRNRPDTSIGPWEWDPERAWPPEAR